MAHWKPGEVVTATGSEPKGFLFPKNGPTPVQPVMVRKKSSSGRRRAVVAHSSQDSVGIATAIIVSHDTLRKLDCGSGDSVEYKKANVWNVLWANRWTAILAGLGFVIVVGQAIASIASFIPASDRTAEIVIVGICAAVMLVAAFGVAIITVWQASSG
jgi:hypothetical protein